MVRITVVLDSLGTLRKLRMRGHVTGASKGQNLACAAVSLVVRSVARLVAAQSGWKVDGLAPYPGDFFLDIQGRPDDQIQWLKGVTDTLLQALSDIDEEYPSALSVSTEEIHNGS